MKQNREIWVDVPEYKDYYQVSNQGRVRSLDRTVIDSMGRKRFYKGKIIGGSDNGAGYKTLALSRDGKQEKFLIHQVVAMTFLNHTPDGHQLVVDHISGVKADNRVENLRIVSHRDNNSTCYRKDRNSLSSEFVGIYRFRNKWRAQIQLKNKKIYLGLFNNEEDASDTYQKALGELENGTFKIEDYRASFTSNFKGITFHKTSRKWLCQPTINGKQVYLGLFSTEEEAHQMILLFESAQLIEK